MSLAGDLISLSVALAQEGGVLLGVGAVTLTLVAHLLALHSKRDEWVHGYVRAALQLRAIALIVIILSGIAAIVVHVQTDTGATILTPAYLFKWLLIGILTVLHFLELKVHGYYQDALEGFEGANWYALLIVHSVAPVASWVFIGALYAAWLAAFGVVWAAFVWYLRWQGSPKAPAPKPAPAPAPTPAPMPPLAPVAPKPAAAPAPVAVPEKKVEVHPTHSLLPVVAELELPAPAPAPKPPASKPEPAAPKPNPPVPTLQPQPLKEEFKPEVPMPDLDEKGLPGLRVMPKRPEDIEGSSRPPIVKLEADEGPRSQEFDAQ